MGFTAVAKFNRRPLPDLKRLMLEKAKRSLESAALAAHMSIERGELDGPASGRLYPSRRSGRVPGAHFPRAFGNVTETGDMHQASAPGEQPHADTRDLLSGITVRWAQSGYAMAVFVGWTGEDAVIAATMEYGRADGRMAPRPFKWQAVEKGKEAMVLEAKL